jgi:hypothetical protein
MKDLPTFLREMAETPFAWGRCDCMLMLADWVLLCRGVDPAADARGRYSTFRQMLRLVRREGGVEAFATARFDRCLSRANEPQSGDIGLIRAPGGLAGAIRTGHGWAQKAERGLVVRPTSFIVAWSV